MATNDPTDLLKKRAAAVTGNAPVGDAAQATALSTQPRSLDVPAAQRLALPRPADFVADAAGNVQRNTPSASWSSTPGAAPPPTAAARMASVPTAPNLTTSLGATNPTAIDPVAATRATVVPPSATGGSTLSLAQPPAAPAPRLALPAPSVAVGTDGVAMTAQDLSARAQLGATPDVVRAQASHPGFTNPSAPPPAAAPPAPAPVFNRPATGGPLADQAGNISADDFARRTAAARAATAPTAAPAAAVPPAATATAEGVAAAAQPAIPLAQRAGQAVSGAAGAIGRAARLGAAPVETAPGAFGTTKTAPGQGRASAGLLATTAGLSALSSLNRPTEDYRARLGMDKTGGVVGDTVARTAGVLSDFGANVLDIPVNLLNATGKTDIRPFSSMFSDTAGQYKPEYATDKGGLNIRPDAAQTARNTTWQEEQDLARARQIEAARAAAGGGSGGTEAQPTAAAQLAAPPTASTAGAPPAAVPPQVTGQQPATATAAAPVAAAPAPLPGAPVGAEQIAAAAALKSPTIGSATINGRTLTPDQIIDAGKRLNTVGSQAFTNVGAGVLNSEVTGGKTLTQDQAVQRIIDGRNSAASLLAGNDGSARVIPGTGSSGGGIGGRDSGEDRDATVRKLMSDISTAIGSGKRRTARELVGQLSAYNQSGRVGERADAASRLAAGRTRTPLEQAKDLAELSKTTADTENSQFTLAQNKQLAALQNTIASETDPAKRADAAKRLRELKGEAPQRRELKTLKIPVGSGLDAKNIEVPYDEETGQLAIPDGFMELLGAGTKKPATAK